MKIIIFSFSQVKWWLDRWRFSLSFFEYIVILPHIFYQSEACENRITRGLQIVFSHSIRRRIIFLKGYFEFKWALMNTILDLLKQIKNFLAQSSRLQLLGTFIKSTSRIFQIFTVFVYSLRFTIARVDYVFLPSLCGLCRRFVGLNVFKEKGSNRLHCVHISQSPSGIRRLHNRSALYKIVYTI